MANTVSSKLLILLGCLQFGAAQAVDPPDPNGEWRDLTPDSIRQALPATGQGTEVEVVPLRLLYTFYSTTFFELSRALDMTQPDVEPAAIMLSNGTYGLSDVARLVDDPGIFKQAGSGVFVSYRPIFVAPSATLVIDQQELRLSRSDVASLIYRGVVYVTDSTVTTWDDSLGSYGPRATLSERELLDHASQPARPFLLGLRGSSSYFASSHFRGLGYYGRSSTFGISLAAREKSQEFANAGLGNIVLSLPKPVGVMIGNTVSHGLFGFYSSNSGPIVLLGNVFRNNVIYNVGAHNNSEHPVIARNITHGAKFKYGIVVAIGVRQAQIVENISFANGDSGILVERRSDQATIQGNITFGNKGDGIGLRESDGHVLTDNLIFGNHQDGVHLRNSADVQLQNNVIEHNASDGIELTTENVAESMNRDPEQEPFHQSGSAQIVDNAVHRNLSSAVSGKGNVEVLIRGNDFDGSGPQFFAGDLRPDATRILQENGAQGYRYSAAAREESE